MVNQTPSECWPNTKEEYTVPYVNYATRCDAKAITKRIQLSVITLKRLPYVSRAKILNQRRDVMTRAE